MDTEIEVTVTGAELDGLSGWHASHPGITATLKAKQQFAVKIAPTVPPGVYDVSVSGELGVTNPRAFVVGDLAEVVKTKPCDAVESALEVAVGSAISGAVTAAAADYFRFTAAADQRILVVPQTAAVDSRLRPILTLLSADGRELAASHRGEPLDFTAPDAGPFFLRVRDLTFAGGAEYFYRLLLTTGPYLDSIFPPSAARGQKATFTLLGRNLPGGTVSPFRTATDQSLESLEVTIDVPAAADAGADGLSNPAAADVDAFAYALPSPVGRSNPVCINFSDTSIVAEEESAAPASDAQTMTPPVEIAGRFHPARDVDAFRFEAKKGEAFWVEVISERLGFSTKPFILIRREGAEPQEIYGPDGSLGGKRFRVVTEDPAGRFEAKEDGRYRVEVRDLFGTLRAAPEHVYRLRIRREAADFQLLAFVEPPPIKDDDRTAIPRASIVRSGGTTAVRVLALRSGGFSGEIEVLAENLPPAVRSASTTIPAGKNEGLVLLTAADAVQPAVAAMRVIGRAKMSDQEVLRTARSGTVRWPVTDSNENPVETRLTRHFLASVAGPEPAPVTVAPQEDKVWETTPNGRVEVALQVTRRGEFKDVLKLKASGAAGVEAFKELEIAPADITATAVFDIAALKLPIGVHRVFLHGQTKGKFRGKDVTYPLYTPPLRIHVQAEPKAAGS